MNNTTETTLTIDSRIRAAEDRIDGIESDQTYSLCDSDWCLEGCGGIRSRLNVELAIARDDLAQLIATRDARTVQDAMNATVESENIAGYSVPVDPMDMLGCDSCQ